MVLHRPVELAGAFGFWSKTSCAVG